MTPLTKLLIGVGLVGLGYAVTRKPKRRRRRTTSGAPDLTPSPTPRPEPTPTPTPPPATPDIAPTGTAPPDWGDRFNEGVDAAIDAGRQTPGVVTGDDLKLFVVETLYPESQWPPPAGALQWQEDVWVALDRLFFDRANISSWPFYGTLETANAAVTLWVSARRHLAQCREEISDPEAQKMCTASKTYPGVSWPPTDTSPKWMHAAWTKIGEMLLSPA